MGSGQGDATAIGGKLLRCLLSREILEKLQYEFFFRMVAQKGDIRIVARLFKAVGHQQQ